MIGRIAALVLLSACRVTGAARAQGTGALSPDVRAFVRVGTPRVVLEHVAIIDGTGAPRQQDRNVTIERGTITGIAEGADETPRDSTTILDLRGFSVLPGIVGMHDHLWFLALPNERGDGTYDRPALPLEMTFSAPRLYLAAGVTTMRTAGSMSPYEDIQAGRLVETGMMPGPHMDVTGPYLEGANPRASPGDMQLTGADDARRTVAFWAERGATSFKAYTDITRDELRAAILEAHRRGLKVTGHLCSVTYPEAIALGIDNLEHGFMSNTANDPGKQPDQCSASGGDYTLAHTVPGSADAERLIQDLVRHHVAVTSTLVLRAAGLPGIGIMADGRPLQAGLVDAMAPALREAFETWRAHPSPTRLHTDSLVRIEMALEREFVAAGGLLLTGPDPVGLNGDVPGFGDQRAIELLVDAGFTPLEAIRIATLNGATYLGRDGAIGSVAVGKHADIVVVRGDPSARIGDIENVELVFKDGVGYDPARLRASAQGRYGAY